MAKKIKLNQNENSKYYLSLSGILKRKKQKIEKAIGIDINFEEIVLSNGMLFETENMKNKLNLFTLKLEKLKQRKSKIIEQNKKVLKTLCKADNISMYNEKKLTKEAKSLYREILSSDKRYRRLIKQINNLYEKRTNIQNDLYHKINNKIAKISDLCFIEDLSIEGMIESKKVRNDNLYNASLSKFLTIVNNNTMGKVAIKVNPYNTSKKCSTIGCNYVYKELTELNIREWYCNHCDTLHHRDLNAAKNILYKGLLTQGDEYKYSIELSNKPVKVFV